MDTAARDPSPDGDASGLIEHLISAQELAWQRIAERIHDDPMQALVAVGLRMQLLASRLPPGEVSGLDELNDAVSSAMSTLRGLLVALRPRALDHERLGFILEAYLEQTTEDWEIEAELDYEVTEEPPSRIVLTVFRVVQSALDNVRKHAKATQVVVKVSSVDGGLLTEVSDNGTGSARHGKVQPADTDLGLLEMRERALSAAGWWELDAGDGSGSTVRFWLPLTLPEAVR
jgi:signal transduction histidine kinase